MAILKSNTFELKMNFKKFIKNQPKMEDRKKYMHNYYLEHKDNILNRVRNYQKLNHEKVLEINQKYYKKNRLSILEKRKQKSKSMTDEHKEKMRLYHFE